MISYKSGNNSLFVLYIYSICLLLLPAICQGQEITGRVVDKSSIGIPFANVVLLSQDSVYIKGAMTAEDGSFTIDGDTDGGGKIRISSVGYKTKTIGLLQRNLGNIILDEDETLLQEVTVKGSRPMHKMTGEGLTTNVSGTMLEKVGTAEDVLKFIPSLRKTDSGYEVFGKGAPLIYLNGKEVRDLTELDRLSSEEIKEVTLISNPGAEYNTSAQAVLKIKTLPKKGEGFGANYRQVLGAADRFFHKEQLDWNYRRGGFDLFGTMYYSLTKSKQRQTNHQAVQDGNVLLLNTVCNIYSRSSYGEGILGFNYVIDQNNSIGATYTLSIPLRRGGNWDALTDVSVAGTQTELLQDKFNSKDRVLPDHDIAAYYNGQIGKLQFDWNGEIYITKMGNTQESVERELLHHDNRTVLTNYDNKNQLYATKLVVSTPLSIGKLYVGTEYTDILRNSSYTVNGSSNLLPDDSNNRSQEWSLSGFSSYGVVIDKVSLNVGMRFEHVSFKYYNNDTYVAEQSRIYNNVFPNLSISFPIKQVNVNFAYTAKASRPTYAMLSGNLQYNDRYTYQGGNPALRSCQLHTAELRVSYHWVQFNADWRYYHDGFYQYVKPFDASPDITVYSFKNIPHYQIVYLGVTLSPKVGWWQPMFDFRIRKQFFHVKEDGFSEKYNHPIALLTFNNVIRLPKSYVLNVDMNYISSGHSTAIKLEGNGGVNIGIYKGFLKDRLTLNLQFRDIFNSYKSASRLYYDDRNIYSWKKTDSRQVLLTLRYKFNSVKSKYKGTGAGTEDKKRI